jgi:hypothetical protein
MWWSNDGQLIVKSAFSLNGRERQLMGQFWGGCARNVSD